MKRTRRKFNAEQKLQILHEAEQEDLAVALRKYELSQSLFYKWKYKFDSSGKSGLQGQYKRVDPEVRRLEEENERLKRIVAKQVLEIEVKSELLKKLL